MSSRVARPALAITVLLSLILSIYYTSQHALPIKQLDAPCPALFGSALSNSTGAVAACDPVRRASFVRRVYAMTALQLATSSVVAWLVSSSLTAKNDDVLPFRIGQSSDRDLRQTVATIVYSEPFLCIWTMVSFALLAKLIVHRTDPWLGFHLFEAFAVVEGCWLGLACAFVPWVIVASAALVALYIFGMLTIVSIGLSACGISLGFLEPLLAEALVTIVGAGLLRVGLGLEKEAVWATGGIALWSAYILFDSNRITRRYSEDEYIAGALDLYLDVINLFLELLQAMSKSK